MRLTRVLQLLIGLILILGFFYLSRYLLTDLETQSFQSTEESLVDTANLLASIAAKEDGLETLSSAHSDFRERELNALIHGIEKVRPGLGFYITDREGKALYDTSNKFKPGADLSRLNDVARTLSGNYGTRSTRENEADPDSSVLYIAAPITQNGEIVGVLTVFKNQSDVRPFIDRRRKEIAIGIFSVGLGITALILAVFFFVFQPIGRLTSYAQAISNQQKVRLPNLGKGREVNTLGHALEEMREALEGRRYIQHYVETLTHELKSPLTAIKGSTELLTEPLPEQDKQRFLANIANQTERCERMVQQMLALASLEANAPLPEKESVKVDLLIEACLRELSSQANARGVELLTDKDSTAQTITGHSQLIYSALVNLVENAIRFSPEAGQVKVRLFAKETHVVIEVTDQGSGLQDFVLKSAFKRFFSYAPEGLGKGNGLGLTLVQEVMELHGGTASLKNTLPQGATAQLTFPVGA